MEEQRLHLKERHVRVAGTKSSWYGLAGWLDEARRVGSVIRCSEAQDQRVKRVYRSLTLHDIHACREVCILEEFELAMREGRYVDRAYRGFFRHFTRPELGQFISEAQNQTRWVKAGCPTRKAGPALAPERLPDSRLDHLIQSHRDLNIVEQLRAEKARRLAAI
jgi:hypothetical protein